MTMNAPFVDRKGAILDATDGGLKVMRRIFGEIPEKGRHGILNPFYDDSRGSLSVFLKDTWRFHDFGNEAYSGDCFDAFALAEGLDIKTQFVEVLTRMESAFGVVPAASGSQPYRMKQLKPKVVKPKPVQTVFHSRSEVVHRDHNCTFRQWMAAVMGKAGIAAFAKYWVSAGFDGKGATWFPYIDQDHNIRTAKHTRYRVLDDGWITKKGEDGKPLSIFYEWPEGVDHKVRPFFGEHLIPRNPNHGKTIGIVEAEDTAVILEASGMYPDIIWIATGGKDAKPRTFEILRDHPDVRVFIDRDDKKAADRYRRILESVGVVVTIEDPIGRFDEASVREIVGDHRFSSCDMKDWIIGRIMQQVDFEVVDPPWWT